VRVWVHAARVRALTFVSCGRVEEGRWGAVAIPARTHAQTQHKHAHTHIHTRTHTHARTHAHTHIYGSGKG